MGRRQLICCNPFSSVFVFCVLLSTTSSALGFDTLDGDSTRWSTTPDFSIGRLSGALAHNEQIAAIRASFSSWQNIRGVDLNFSEVAANGDITIDFLIRWPAEFGRYAAGVTQTSRGRGRISSAIISINEQNFEWSTNLAGDEADIQGVVTHEIGHALGFGHSFYRDSTMYWSDTGADLRALSGDDQRGAQFLYGNAEGSRLGQLCDHCGSHDDCAAGAFCLALEDERSFCGQPCDQGCPQNTACFELANGGETCAPTAGGCSDETPGPFEAGDYCFGAEQCGPNMTCLVLPGTAQCVRNCTPGRNECPEGRCLGGDEPGSTGLCVVAGDGVYGAPCDSDFDCESFACLANGADSLCAGLCSPNVDVCPNGVCVETGNAVQPGLCLPPGQVREGQPCATLVDRCVADHLCVRGRDEVACRRLCDPFSECPDGYGCGPATDGAWACFPPTGVGLGDECGGGRVCGPGLLCAPMGRDGTEVCGRLCELDNPTHCGAASCIDYGVEFGVCPTGNRPMGTPCDGDTQCLGGLCVWTLDGDQCSQGCSENRACPEGWACLMFGNSRQGCFRANEESGTGGSAGGAGSPGGGSGTGGSAGQTTDAGSNGPGDMGRGVARDAGTNNGTGGASGQGGTGGSELPNGMHSNEPLGQDSGTQSGGYYVVKKEGGGCASVSRAGSHRSLWVAMLLLVGLTRRRHK